MTVAGRVVGQGGADRGGESRLAPGSESVAGSKRREDSGAAAVRALRSWAPWSH